MAITSIVQSINIDIATLLKRSIGIAIAIVLSSIAYSPVYIYIVQLRAIKSTCYGGDTFVCLPNE